MKIFPKGNHDFGLSRRPVSDEDAISETTTLFRMRVKPTQPAPLFPPPGGGIHT